MKYASQTNVSPDRSRAEIERKGTQANTESGDDRNGTINQTTLARAGFGYQSGKMPPLLPGGDVIDGEITHG